MMQMTLAGTGRRPSRACSIMTGARPRVCTGSAGLASSAATAPRRHRELALSGIPAKVVIASRGFSPIDSYPP
jgi:hypothetical protein